jgi:hypothetical protein
MTVTVKESTIEFKKLDPELRKQITYKTVLRMYDGEDIADVAASIGVKNPALLLAAVIEDFPQELRFIRAGEALLRRMNLEKLLLKGAVTGDFKEKLDFQKQQSLMKAAEWDLERMSRDVFEPPQKKSAAAPTIVMQFTSLRGNEAPQTIEAVDKDAPPALPITTRFHRLLGPESAEDQTPMPFAVVDEK